MLGKLGDNELGYALKKHSCRQQLVLKFETIKEAGHATLGDHGVRRLVLK